MTLGVAVVGLGMAHKPHIQSLRELDDRVRIVACQSPTAARREAFAKLHPDLPLSADLDAVLGDARVNAVILLTPPMTHRDLVQLVRRCLEAPLDLRFAVFYGVSRNTWRIWDIEDAGSALGYAPVDDAESFR